MKKYGAENLPAYEPVKAALSAPSDAPARLSDDRRRRILNAARAAAAFQPTFADRLARWLDFGTPTVSRYAMLRALVPVAITILIVFGIGGLLLPSLSMHKRASPRSVELACMAPETVKLEELKNELQPFDAVRAEFPADSTPSAPSDPTDRSYFFSGGDVAGQAGAAPAAAPPPGDSRDDTVELSAPVPVLTKSPLIIRNLYGNRMSAANREGEARREKSALARGAPDKDGDEITIVLGEKNQPPAGPVVNGALSMPSTPSISSTLSADAEPAEAPAKAKAAQAERPQPSTFRAAGFNPFVETVAQPFSTFSIDVDSAAYTLARNYLNQGQLPPPEAVRTEELVNAFDYHDAPPAGALFAVRSEATPSPFGPGLHLLRLGVKARHLGREENRRAVLTVLIDTSGSMSAPDRLGLISQALRLLVDRLAPDDLVALVQFDSHARLVLDYTRAADKARILKALASIQTSGSTNLEEGMRLAYECARRAYQPGAGNRVLLLSDGAANLGSSSAEDILAVVADSRKQGIFCSVYGVGRGGYNDVMLETLANKGDGSYVYLDTIAEARRVFVDDFAATLNTVAADVKIQVEFNPARVKVYRQLGYENRALRKEDFRNDAIDAGEVGSGQAVTALYELSLVPNAPRGPLGTVRVRYRDTETGRIGEIEAPLSEALLQTRLADASPAFKLAAGAAEFAEILRGSPYAEDGDLREVAALLRPVALDLSLDSRVQELLRLVEKAADLKRGSN